MKKLLLIILVIFGMGTALNAQNLVSEEDIAKMNLSAKDSLMITYMDGYASQISKPRYQLFKTQNMWTFLKLDTATGLIWQVQYSVKGDLSRFQEPLNTDLLIVPSLRKSMYHPTTRILQRSTACCSASPTGGWYAIRMPSERLNMQFPREYKSSAILRFMTAAALPPSPFPTASRVLAILHSTGVTD